jgi:membrane associated rhomboid family serine protease
MWIIEIPNLVTGGSLNAFGIAPRTVRGLAGIVVSPLLHGSINHLAGNTMAWLVAGALLALSDGRRFLTTMAIAWFTSGLGAWLVSASNTRTIGASGVVFGFFGYVLARGVATRSVLRVVVSLLFTLPFGLSILLGLLPEPGISWQAHLFGLLGGVVAAFVVGRRAS